MRPSPGPWSAPELAYLWLALLLLLAQLLSLGASAFFLVGAWRQVLLNMNMAGAITGWPLGDGGRHSDVTMENLIGDDIDRIPAKAEWNLPGLTHVQSSFYLSDEEIGLVGEHERVAMKPYIGVRRARLGE